MVNTGPSAGPCSALARISPSSMTIMNSALSPSRMTMSPGATRSSWHLETNQSRSSCERSEKTATLRNCSASCSGGVVNSSVMRDELFWRLASLYFGQVLMHKLHDDGAFANAGSDTLHGAVAHIANDKNTGDVSFEQSRIAVERPGRRPLAVTNQVGAGEDEAAIVALDQVAEPFGAGLRPDENKEAGSGQLLRFCRRGALDGNAGKARFTVNGDHTGARPNFDVRSFFNLFDEIVRHGAGERWPADEHNHFFGELGKMHGGLARGVGAADDIDGFALTGNGFGGAAAVIDARTLQLVDAGHGERAPLDAHGEKKDVAGD